MNIIIIIIWLLFGVAAWCNVYYSSIKDWWFKFEEDYRKEKYNIVLMYWKTIGLIIIPFGLFSFLLAAIMIYINIGKKSFCYYFKIPKV